MMPADPEPRRYLEHSIRRLRTTLESDLSPAHEPVLEWIHALSPTAAPEDYFLHPRSYPILQLPVWATRGASGGLGEEDLEALTYSTVCGYYAIRLMDDLMDRPDRAPMHLLPSVAFFLGEFQAVYTRWFPPEHVFWSEFRELWYGTQACAIADVALETIDREAFERISGNKMRAGLIPVSAVLHRTGLADRIPAWRRFCDQLGPWVQMMDDLFDWHQDLRAGSRTYFLSEAQTRRAPAQSVMEWVVLGGFDWGVEALNVRLVALREAARGVGSPDVDGHLDQRAEILEELKGLGRGLTELGRLTRIVCYDADDRRP